MIRREGREFLPPFDDVTLEPGDTLVLAATRKVLSDSLQQAAQQAVVRHDDEHEPSEGNGDKRPQRRSTLSIAEAVVAPASRLVGANVDPEIIHAETGMDLIGIQRRSRMARGAISNIRLESGDVILLLGEQKDIRKLRSNRNLLLLDWLTEELSQTHHAFHALIIFMLTITVAATNILPIAISALLGAVAMIATGCLNVRQALRAIDARVFLLVGTAFALATPLQITGGAHFVATSVVDAFSGAGPAVLLSAFFLLTAILTNFLSNAATAALMTPIAVSAAREIGVDPMPFIYGLIFALNCSFATPIAYQTNLIVMGPGNYSFKDFVRGGLPLVILMWVTFTLFAPFYFDL
jgi:di/tricarboxylate transporter